VVLSRFFPNNQTLRFGSEYFYSKDKNRFNDLPEELEDHLSATFAEGDIYIGKSMAAKLGVRFEYSSLLQKANMAPRAGLAYRFYNGGQLNLAYGMFYQKPDDRFLRNSRNLDFSRADHYVLNYQKKSNNRFFRVEIYYKDYKGLITTIPSLSNQGDGQAKGLELFWRDKMTFKALDYWITYTYLDTERKFLNYPTVLRPGFTTPHTVTIAAKKYFQEIKFNVNAAYTITSGRPYYYFDPTSSAEQEILNRGTTPSYSGLNLSFAYLTTFFKKWKDFSGIGMGMNNVFGNRQVFGYNYNYEGSEKTAITLPAVSSFYIGVFIGFGTDRTDDFLNENL
jgi:outer membrane receptor for ferrienterochelin and colicin